MSEPEKSEIRIDTTDSSIELNTNESNSNTQLTKIDNESTLINDNSEADSGQNSSISAELNSTEYDSKPGSTTFLIIAFMFLGFIPIIVSNSNIFVQVFYIFLVKTISIVLCLSIIKNTFSTIAEYSSKYLKLNLGFDSNKNNLFYKTSLFTYIAASFLSIFVYFSNQIQHFFYQFPNLVLTPILFNNNIFLHILTKFIEFANFCSFRVSLIGFLITAYWIGKFNFIALNKLNEFTQQDKSDLDGLVKNKNLISNFILSLNLTKNSNYQKTQNTHKNKLYELYTSYLADRGNFKSIGKSIITSTIVLNFILVFITSLALNVQSYIVLLLFLMVLPNSLILKSAIKKLIIKTSKNINTFAENKSKQIIIPYKLNSGFEKWFIQRFGHADDSKKNAAIFLVCLAFFTNLPNYALELLTKISQNLHGYSNLTNEQLVINSMQNANVKGTLSLLFVGLFIFISNIFKRQKRKPQFIIMSNEGLYYARKQFNTTLPIVYYDAIANKKFGYNKYFKPLIQWQAIKSIEVESDPKKPLNKVLIFKVDHLKYETQKFKKNILMPEDFIVKIDLDGISDYNHRELILKTIEKYGANIPRDAQVVQLLQTPSEHSYTDIWLEALASPPKRSNLKPLDLDDKLKDDRYLIKSFLGSGGQGSTYIAFDQVSNREVVLKEFILPIFVDLNVRKEALNQFEAEAKILKKIEHPQVVKLLDYFTFDHRAYLVLEYIDSISLKDLVLQNGAISQTRAINIIKQVGEILSYLHKMDPPIIHRDLTPDNILLQENDKVKLIDFNVAKQMTGVTIVSKVVGKHAYMPPEQFQGKATTQSDIYSLGASLFYLLTAIEPTPISISSPKSINNQIDGRIDEIVKKATSLKLENRYSTIEELLADIAKVN